MKIYQYTIVFEGKKFFSRVGGVSTLTSMHEIDFEKEKDAIYATFRKRKIRNVKIVSFKLANVVDLEKKFSKGRDKDGYAHGV